MSLEMKSFVLKPRARTKYDLFAKASHAAMYAYADVIEEVDPELSNFLRNWAADEITRQLQSSDL